VGAPDRHLQPEGFGSQWEGYTTDLGQSMGQRQAHDAGANNKDGLLLARVGGVHGFGAYARTMASYSYCVGRVCLDILSVSPKPLHRMRSRTKGQKQAYTDCERTRILGHNFSICASLIEQW
jgi:hypothetical protein